MTGKELKIKRVILEMTQKEMADALGLKPNTISRYENDGQAIPKLLEVAIEGLECRQGMKGTPADGIEK